MCVDLDINLFFLFRARLGGLFGLIRRYMKTLYGKGILSKYLSDVICSFLFVLCERNSTLPDVIGTFVGLADAFQLGNGSVLLFLLSKVLIEGQSVVLFFSFFVLAATGAFGFGFAFSRSGCSICNGSGFPSVSVGLSYTPAIGNSTTTPGVGCFGGSVIGSSFLGLKFSVAVVSAPRIVDLLVGIAVGRISLRESKTRGEDVRFPGLTVSVVRTTFAA
jgi:hypothetical protein